MYVGVQRKALADTAQPQILGLPTKCPGVAEEVLSALEGKAGQSRI